MNVCVCVCVCVREGGEKRGRGESMSFAHYEPLC